MKQVNVVDKEWTENEVRELLRTSDEMVCASLKKLYELQTNEEKHSKETHDKNGVGFNAYDAKFLTSVTQFYLKAGFLTQKQLVSVRKRIYKYVKQLTKIANNQI